MADLFENSLRVMRVSLLFSGIKTHRSKWNDKLEVFVNKFLFYTNLITLYSVIFGEIAWIIHGVQSGRSFTDLSLALPLITITLLGTVKSYNLYVNRNIVCEVIDTLQDMHPKENFKKQDRNSDKFPKYNTDFTDGYSNDMYTDIELKDKQLDVTNESVKMLSTVVNLLKSISGSVMIMFCLAPLVAMFIEYQAKGKTGVQYPYQVEYWFDIYGTRWWPVLYLHQVVATIVVCVNLFGAETLFYVVCTYIGMHFRFLCHRLENLKGTSSRLKEDLVDNLVKHQLLIHLVNQAEKLFSKPALIHIITSSLLICLSAFNMTVTGDMKTIFAFLTFLMLSLSQVFLLCFFGDKLVRSSTAVSCAIYDCPWYDLDAQTKKAVLIIIMRSQKPCKLTAANFADLNLLAFTTILSRSWSYFALLKTIYK